MEINHRVSMTTLKQGDLSSNIAALRTWTHATKAVSGFNKPMFEFSQALSKPCAVC